MGMAAGQARLLSITSRMSDNELRAQMINNEKMRLATKSSQVSEAYTAALNDAQMMFTNYDADNNATYQQLTFNALTAYNPYNNQYAISNASGQVLVSETDAVNYKAANGDLNKFLGYYGLEYTTTYFDNLNEYANADGTIPYSTGTKDNDGNIILANSGYTAEMLKAAYEGTDGHDGYNVTLASEHYYNYSSAISNFDEAYTNWTATIGEEMEKVLTGTIQGNGKILSDLEKDINDAGDISAMQNVLKNISAFVTEAEKLSLHNDTTNAYFNNLQNQIELASTGETTYTKEDGYISYTEDSENKIITLGDNEKTDFQIIKTSSGYTIKYLNPDNDTMETLDSESYELNVGSTISFKYKSEDGDTLFTGIPNYFNNSSITDYTVTESNPLDLDNMKSVAKSVLSSLKSSIYNVWNPAQSIFTNTSSPEYQKYEEAAKNLEKVLFGSNGYVSSEEYPNMIDVSYHI